MKTISEVLKEIRPEYDFQNAGNFIDEGMLDSFDLVTLVAALEDEYSIRIDGLDIVPDNFQTISSIEKMVKRSKAKP